MATVQPVPLDVKLMNWVASTLFVGLVVLGVGSVLLWAARHPAWALGGITVTGDVTHQNAVTFRAQLVSRLTGGFLTMDLREVKQLFETMPWVQQAVVQREFPNRLHVVIKEHQAVAWWGEAGGGKLVNQQGDVFEANPDDHQADGWSELAGPAGQSRQVYALYRSMQALFDPIDREVQRLELDSSGNWKLRLDNGARIELGRGTSDELLARTGTFTSTVTQLTHRYGRRDIESADLRYPNGYAVRMRGVSTVTDGKTVKPVAPPPVQKKAHR
jgi:cell division protein FtsQ